MTLEEVQKDVEFQVQQVQLVSNEVERLKQQLASEKKNASDTSMELQALKLELEKNKNEAEHLKLMERNSDERRYARSKTRLELEDAKSTIMELREELTYKNSVNRSLGLQLEKTIESNSELLLEIKDLDDLLQSKEREIEELKAETQERESNQRKEDEAALLVLKLEESEQARKELEDRISVLEEASANQVSDDSIQELRADNEMLRKELEKADTEVANTSKENMNLLSQLMILRHQMEEKNAWVQQLEQRLAMEKDQSVFQVEALEKKAKDLQATVNDLREKLRLSEELSQSQLDSNKVFMEDLISNVYGLRARNEELEALVKSSEEKNSVLMEEIEAQQKELLEHEKERSLLMSQRGQLKILREKIATVTENYEIAMERGEDLELAIKALKEEHCMAITSLDEQVKNLEEKFQVANAECLALRAELQMAEARAAEMSEQMSMLSVAREAAEANASSSDAAHTEIKQRYHSLLLDKEKADASLSSLQEAHTQLQEHLKDAEHSCSDAIHQLQEHEVKIIELTKALDSAENQLKSACKKTSEDGIKVTELTEALNSAESQLKGAYEKASELEATVLALQEELGCMKAERGLQNSRIEDLEIKLTHMQEALDESSKSLSATEERIRNLQVQNDDLSEMLHSAVAYKEDVVSRLELSLAKELELEKKLQKTQAALQDLEDEKATSSQSTEEPQERKRPLKDKRSGPIKGKQEDGNVQELHKSLRTQLEVMKHSMHEMKADKEKAESSLQKLQTSNASLTLELKKWKEKVKAGNEELALWKEKVKTSKSLGTTSSEERTSPAMDSSMKGANKSTDLDLKGEMLKVRKQSTDLRRKLLEQEEEKEDMKKKLLSVQKELQRKSELLNLSEKRLKEKEKEQRAGQRPPTRHSSSMSRRIGMDSNMPQGGKNTVDLIERVKLLEAELNIRTVELEATQFLLQKKEAATDINPHMEKDESVEIHARTHKQEHSQNRNPEPELLMDVASQETPQDEVQRSQLENQKLKGFLSQHQGNELACTGTNQDPLQCEMDEDEQSAAKAVKRTHLEEELQEMKDRYSQLSLQFAELQVEREELVLTIRNLSKDSYK